MKTQNKQDQFTVFERNGQLVFTLNSEIMIPKNAPVRLLNAQLEELEYGKLYEAYSSKGRKSAADPRVLFKVLVYGYLCGIYSSRKLEEACQYRIDFRWLLEDRKAPDHCTFARFRTGRCRDALEDLFYQLVQRLEDIGETDHTAVFIDGTKLESCAGRYTFVWRKSVEKQLTKVKEEIRRETGLTSPLDLQAYLNAAEKYGVLAMFYLELVTGIRKGELTALLWSDLNIERRTISVSKQAGWNGEGELEIRRPKTENSIREISIPQTAVDLLLEEHSKHPNNPYLFPSPKTSGMYHPDSIVNLHKKILKDAGLPHIRFHDLRHTFATVALQNGVDVKTVSNMLGHYDAGFTLRTYTHATRQMQESAAEKMGNFMEQVL